MKVRNLLLVCAATCFMAMLAPAEADAAPRGVGFGHRNLPPPPPTGGHHGFIGFPGVWVVEREVVQVIEREVVHEDPPPPAPPPPPPRKPYAIGASYDTLPPNGCMKMIADGASYYLCSGEWYRQVGKSQYKAIAKP